MTLKLEMWEQVWPLAEAFAIARGTQTEQPTLQLRVSGADGASGRGEACGVSYAGETPSTMMAQLEYIRGSIERGIDRETLLEVLPPGGARFALDAALWDLEAKRTGISPFAVAGLEASPVTISHTIGIRSLESYEQTAQRLSTYKTLKVKVDSHDPIDAIRAVRRGAPRSELIIDPNQSWSVEMVREFGPELKLLGVVLLEQPIPVGLEAGLENSTCAVPLCADELVADVDDLDRASGRFDMVNIKLDKVGGLTASLGLARAARERGFGLMVGCMNGSSLCMAPAMVLAQMCAFVDLDGPLLMAEDISNGFHYNDGHVARPHIRELWG
jgi:L-alanine-DL-glutamate epimerase-like enolase superfamily enzyme